MSANEMQNKLCTFMPHSAASIFPLKGAVKENFRNANLKYNDY
jgi:hypothetical protein